MVALASGSGRDALVAQAALARRAARRCWTPAACTSAAEDGTVYALDAASGSIVWTYKARGAVKGGIALDGGGRLILRRLRRARDRDPAHGRPQAVVDRQREAARSAWKSGNFYATPAIAYGRVYIGNTDGFVYSFSVQNGALAWRHKTGGLRLLLAPRSPPCVGGTVYAGSYDGKLYAFDAQSGAIRWSHNAGGRISGSPTIIGDVVYFSDLGSKSTEGLNVRTGQQVFSFPDGAFNPAIADMGAIYLVGYSKLYQMLPRSSHREAVANRAASARATHKVRQKRSK